MITEEKKKGKIGSVETPDSEKNNADEGALKALSDLLAEPSLKSSARVLILISLSINKKLNLGELCVLTGLGKSSVQNHLGKLSSSHYISTRNVKTFGGLREVVVITPEGLEACSALLKALQDVQSAEV